MSDIITIPSTTTSDGVVYYQIYVKLPLRCYTLQRRYNEFEQLVAQLARDAGVNVEDLPYQLPAKRWFQRSNVIEERKLELAKLLNRFIQDSQFQNNPLLLKFLQLPINFQFNKQMFQKDDLNKSPLVDLSLIDDSNWLEVYRNLKSNIQDVLEHNSDKFKTRELINRNFQPGLQNLQTSLVKYAKKIEASEYDRRQTLLKQLTHQVESLRMDNNKPSSYTDAAFGSAKKAGRRVFGQPPPPTEVNETKDTIGLTNQELLQQQIQVHQTQDQEVEQLRRLIARQRELGELIHNEVEDQNNMLDGFHNELETTESKLANARQRAKKITQ